MTDTTTDARAGGQLAAAIRLEVQTPSARYPIEIGEGVVEALPDLLGSVRAPARRVIVSSAPIWERHGSAVRDISEEDPILLPDGERHKTMASVMRIYDALIRAAADRATCLIALGGGVVGDVTGFAAATYLRGVPVVHVPTTLLAQVDSATGGKTGVNHPLGKNLIGAYHQPLAVFVDPRFLATLPRREFRAGLYEVIKYGIIASRPLFDRIEGDLPRLFAREVDALVPVIAESCRIKADIVGRDEREAGPRRALNFGHTAGHALEAVTKYRRFRHGEAVAYGMLVAAALGVRRGTFSPAERDALAALIAKMGPLPPLGDLPAADLIQAMSRDKKVVAGTLHFILPAGIGSTTVATDITPEELTEALVSVGARA